MADPDEVDSLASEAEAQSEETVMPWIWGGVGILVAALFVAWAIFGAPQTQIRQPAAAAPPTKPISQGY
jgi:hypothetical protein